MQHFMQPVEYYRRTYNLIGTYIEDAALYLHKRTGQPIDRCRDFVRAQIKPGGDRGIKIPNAVVLVRGDNGDRQLMEMPITRFFSIVEKKQLILSPSMTAYMRPDQRMSPLANFIAGNLKRRSGAKKEMFEAEMAGDHVTAAIKDAFQTTQKIKNNSLSGGQCSPSTILYNKSAHSTLTSGCRTGASYGNANNEKFLYGNRHYWAPDVAKSNILSIVNHTDMERLAQVLMRYHIQPPTAAQTRECILRSTNPYWRSETYFQPIQALIDSLNPIERAAVVYTGDMYHLAQCNPNFVRDFLTKLSVKCDEPLDVEQATQAIGALDDNTKAFVSMLCVKELAGGTIKDAKARPTDYGIIGATAKKIRSVLDEHHDLVTTLWVSDNIPSSIYYLPNIIRRSAITSDTDSTIFTVQYWTEWFHGKSDFSQDSVAVASAMVYLSAQTIRHILARFTGNAGVAPTHITRLSMKNEFYFPVFVLTSRAKHYFAYVAAREGNVYKEYGMEIKGVALRNSNVPPAITAKAHKLMRKLMDEVIAGRRISARSVLRAIAKIEEEIRVSVLRGDYKFLSRVQIKGAQSYKDPTSSNFTHYQMWEEVFACKYGSAPEPPYGAIKVPLTLKNATRLRAWLAGIEDRQFADVMGAWLTKQGRKDLNLLLLPEQQLGVHGIPSELKEVVDIRNLISQTMEAFYLVLESMGIFMKNQHLTHLVSDDRSLLEEPWAGKEFDLD